MSFLTEYFDEYRELPLRKTQNCVPGSGFDFIAQRKWYDPKKDTVTKAMTSGEIKEFIKHTMLELRGQSTYFNDHCSFLDQDLKTRPFVPKPKRKQPCNEEEAKKLEEKSADIILKPPLALKDTEVMMQAKALYERDPESPTLEPLETHFRTIGYIRPSYFSTGISEYSDTICKLAYENILHDRLPRYVCSNGNKPHWGIPPDKPRQPELDIIPLEGERIY